MRPTGWGSGKRMCLFRADLPRRFACDGYAAGTENAHPTYSPPEYIESPKITTSGCPAPGRGSPVGTSAKPKRRPSRQARRVRPANIFVFVNIIRDDPTHTAAQETARCAVLPAEPVARMVARQTPAVSRAGGWGADRRNGVPVCEIICFGRISPDGSPTSNRFPATRCVQTAGTRGKRIAIRCPDGSGRTLRGNRADGTVCTRINRSVGPVPAFGSARRRGCAVLPAEPDAHSAARPLQGNDRFFSNA